LRDNGGMRTVLLFAFALPLLAQTTAPVTTAPLPPCPAPTCTPPPPPPPPDTYRASDAQRGLEIKYFRESAEYATLARQVYRLATDRVKHMPKPATPWGVVLDVDETVLDNSLNQYERSMYGVPYDERLWASWVERAEAGAIPGVKEFLDEVRSETGKIVFITDRREKQKNVAGVEVDETDKTRQNLDKLGLWKSGDLLCLKTSDADKKANRRAAVSEGNGVCSFGAPLQVLAFVGDQMGDFPQKGEKFANADKDSEFGVSLFLLPNPMYGGWTNAVTRGVKELH
jgi:5'-nucleotidase (lipoprotein e(P4) family)